MAENKDNDKEIGLSEDELNQIMGEDNIFQLAEQKQEEEINLEDTDISIFHEAEEQSSKPEKGQIDIDGLDSLLEEIDLSGDDEGEGTDLGLDDKTKTASSIAEENTLNDEDNSDANIKSINDYDAETININEIGVENTIPKEKSAPEPISEDKPLRFTISTASPKKAKSKKSSPTKKPVVKKSAPKPAKPSTVKSTPAKPKLNQRVSSASKSTNSVAEEWRDEEALRRLFLHLDEMLAGASKEKVKRFALSTEYDLYLAILKKLGI